MKYKYLNDSNLDQGFSLDENYEPVYETLDLPELPEHLKNSVSEVEWVNYWLVNRKLQGSPSISSKTTLGSILKHSFYIMLSLVWILSKTLLKKIFKKK